MRPNREFEMQAVALPENLLLDVVNNPALTNPQGGRGLPNDIIKFIESSVQAARGSRRVLLMRDFIGQAPQNEALDDVAKRLTDLRLQLGTQLMLSGAEPMVERGILSNGELDPRSTDHLRTDKRWANLAATNQVVKINHGSRDCAFETGLRPSHPFLHPETVYELMAPDSRLFGRYKKPDWSRTFYASVAENAAGRKTLSEVLCNSSGLDDIEKVFLDTLNMMDAVKFLHQRKKVHRDIKYDNAFDGGMIFDNLSIADADEVAMNTVIYGSPNLIPDLYNVKWGKKVSPYFRDIFAFAISIAGSISIASGLPPYTKREDILVEFFKKHKSRLYKSSPDIFIDGLNEYFFRSVRDPKLRQAANVVRTMILAEGDYDIAAAQRYLSAIFGSRI